MMKDSCLNSADVDDVTVLRVAARAIMMGKKCIHQIYRSIPPNLAPNVFITPKLVQEQIEFEGSSIRWLSTLLLLAIENVTF